jgi:hypothetical protein
MSLEAALAENTAALMKVAGLLEASNAGREAAVAAITANEGAAPAGRPRKTAADRAAEKAAADAAAAPPASPPPPPPPAEAPAPSIDDLRAAAKAYLNVPEADKPARKEFLKAVTDHLGINQLVDAPEDMRATVIGWFEAKGRGDTVNFSDGEDGAAAEEDEDDIG